MLGAVSVATALALREGITGAKTFEIEHPTGFFSVEMEIEGTGDTLKVTRSALLRTARLLMRGEVMVPASVWPAEGTQ